MVYNIRIDEADWARCGKCGHKLYEILGRTGDIRIKCHSCKSINISERRACNTCRWLADGACMNDKSSAFLQSITDNKACDDWERIERKKR